MQEEKNFFFSFSFTHFFNKALQCLMSARFYVEKCCVTRVKKKWEVGEKMKLEINENII